MGNELRQALSDAHEALESIALAGMSGSGQESEEGMQRWHAQRAWDFISIAARALNPIKTALAASAAPLPQMVPDVSPKPWQNSRMNPWVCTLTPHQARRVGKSSEEVGELGAVLGRLQIQGLHEIDPSSGKTNFQRLWEELADVEAQTFCNRRTFNFPPEQYTARVARKIEMMTEWEAHYDDAPQPTAAHPEQAEGAGKVVWQWRLRESSIDGWDECTEDSFNARSKQAHCETRKLYLHPPTDTSAARPEQVEIIARWACDLTDMKPDQVLDVNPTKLVWHRYDRMAAALLSKILAAQPASTPDAPKPEHDVRKILLEITPGADGMGHEVYAESVADVEQWMTRMGERIEDLELKATPTQPVEKVPELSDEEIREIWARLLKIDAEGSLIKFARAIIARTSEGDKP